MNPNTEPSRRESEDRAAAADREALREHLMGWGIALIVLLAVIGALIIGGPVVLR